MCWPQPAKPNCINQLQVDDTGWIDEQIRGAERMAQLNDKQRETVDTILCAVDIYVQGSSQIQGRCFFIDGPGWTGEWFILMLHAILIVQQQ